MLNIPYNPFRKPISKIEPSDLAVLREVCEGWYVEYKSEGMDTKKIAKSLSSFSNHYGGWLFYGIKESTDGTRTAGYFPGIEASEIPAIEEKIRNAASDCINPTPYFEHKVLYGPCSEIKLEKDKAIIAIAVSSGANPPYIHADGKIYRRVADSSSPKPETDRAILDQLWERGRRTRDRLKDFISQTPSLSKGEDNLCILNLTIMSDPFFESGRYYLSGFEHFVKLMSEPPVPFDNFFTTTDGFVARQVANNDPYNLLLTWKFYDHCTTVVTLPFNSSEISSIYRGGWLNGYEQETKFLDVCERWNLEGGRVLDLNFAFQLIVSALYRHRLLVGEIDIAGPFYIKMNLQNIWRAIPFIDTAGFSDFIESHGIPVIQDTGAFAPPGTSLKSFIVLPSRDIPPGKPSDKDLLESSYVDAVIVFIHLAHALGLPQTVIKTSIYDLILLSNRATKVQNTRNSRIRK